MTPVSSRRRDKQDAPLQPNKEHETEKRGSVGPHRWEHHSIATSESVTTRWRPLNRAVKCVQQDTKGKCLFVVNTTGLTITCSSVRLFNYYEPGGLWASPSGHRVAGRPNVTASDKEGDCNCSLTKFSYSLLSSSSSSSSWSSWPVAWRFRESELEPSPLPRPKLGDGWPGEPTAWGRGSSIALGESGGSVVL